MIVTIQQPLSREVFWHKYAKIPRHTSKNTITEGDFKCIFARNCEVTEQLRMIIIKNVSKELIKNISRPLIYRIIRKIENERNIGKAVSN